MKREISDETWQERKLRLSQDYNGENQAFRMANPGYIEDRRPQMDFSALATASMLDDIQARQIEQGERLARIDEMLAELTGRTEGNATLETVKSLLLAKIRAPTPDPRNAGRKVRDA